ncbi:MAG: hypothetical protein R2851_15655 [Caldilineaceae bacterium]
MAAAVTATWNAATGRDDRHMAAILAACAGDPAPCAVLDAAHHDTFTAAQLRRRFDHFYVEHAEIIPAATAALLRGDVGGFGVAANMSQQQARHCWATRCPRPLRWRNWQRRWARRARRRLGRASAAASGRSCPRRTPTRFWPWQARYAEAFPQRAGDFFVTRAGTSAHRL